MMYNRDKYYFTFGLDGAPYQNGWVLVQGYGLDEDTARKIFDVMHPHAKYSMVYTDEAMRKTRMYVHGNFRVYCHEIIDIQVTDCDRE